MSMGRFPQVNTGGTRIHCGLEEVCAGHGLAGDDCPAVPQCCPTHVTSGNRGVGQVEVSQDLLQATDLQCPTVPGGTPTGGGTWDTPQGPRRAAGRRARNRESREVFQVAREHGLAKRHAAKLRNLRKEDQ